MLRWETAAGNPWSKRTIAVEKGVVPGELFLRINGEGCVAAEVLAQGGSL